MRTLTLVATRIRVLVAAAVVLAIAFGAALVITVRSARGGLDLIGHHSAPVVVSTSNLHFALSDMDAQVANALLVGDRTDLGVTRDIALSRYEARRLEVTGHLQQTAAYAGRDPAFGKDLRRVLDALGRYQALAGQAMLAQSQAPAAGAGQPPAQALDLYRRATDLMHEELLPAAQQMIADETAQVEREYRHASSSATIWSASSAVLGLGLLGVLVALQIVLAVAHHRVLNPAIAVATLAVLGVFITGLTAATDADRDLYAAKTDAFDYTVMLHQARAFSHDGYADEARYLLDPARRPEYESAFLDKSQRLVRTDATHISRYDTALDRALSAYFTAERAVTFDGYLGRSLRHVAFPGELAAGESALRGYQAYQAADRRLRALVAGGDLAGAIRSYTGQTLGGTSATFNAYIGTLNRLISINETGFAATVSAGENALRGWIWRPPVLAVLVVVLVLAGAAPRLAEYRA
jgi:hypothetical protein